MASALGWIDFSSEHRDKVRSALDLIGTTAGIVDELGIGAIRDAIAEYLFPGISTIQTRAKYFTLTALLLKKYEKEEAGKSDPRPLDDYLLYQERQCRVKLLQQSGNGSVSQVTGIIGARSGTDIQRGVVRRPSSIYWNGLRTFGLVYPPHLSINEFGARLAKRRKSSLHYQTEGDIQDEVPDVYVLAPSVSDQYWDDLAISMQPEEAEFLVDKIISSRPQSLLARILQSKALTDQLLGLRDYAGFSAFSELPALRSLSDVDASIVDAIATAAKFSTLIFGAHIRYNVQVQRRFGTNRRTREMEDMWDNWRSDLSSSLGGWNTDELWTIVTSTGVNVHPVTERFVTEWIASCQTASPSALDRLVRDQEIWNKDRRARLHPEAKETVQDWVGLQQLDYRLPNVRRLVQDIGHAEASAESRSA